tara:strand:+ start:545 stop:1366 length:822 start_codon:yes stop_codon:yes gene_type:complete
LLGRLIKAPAAFAVLWPVLLIVGGYAAWHRWGAVHVAGKYSGIDPTLIQVTAPPAHVRTNVVKTVYRDTAMEGLSILDREATAKIASAFSMHPWVRKVIGVRKLPGGQIDVRLEYRTPVAMVHVYKPNDPDNRSYFFPVDGEGVLLPGNEFAEAETRNYIYIEVPDVYTSNAVGTPFGDAAVEAASALASVLSPYREKTQIRSIGIHGDPRQTEVLQMELTMQSGARMTWGSPPGNEVPGEPTVQMKLKSLLGADLRQDADLRVASPTQAIQR